jgi:hypothetical protein
MRSRPIGGSPTLGSIRARVGLLALTAACGRLGFEEVPILEFVDDEQAHFDQGQYGAGAAVLEYHDGFVRLAEPFDPKAAGIFVSRPFDTGSPDAVWQTLAWIPRAPTGKPLPDNRGSDEGYAADAVDMTGSILLLHLDGDGAPGQGTKVVDRSGKAHDGLIVLAGQNVSHVPGVFGSGLDIERDAYVSVDGTRFDFGTGDFTYAIWVRMYDCAQSNDNRIAMGGGGAGDRPHMWIGARCPETCADKDGAFMNFLDDTRVGPTLSPCTGTSLEDGGWHHLAGVKQGHAPAEVRLYVDGRKVDIAEFDFGAASHTYTGGEIRLGGFNLGGTQYNTRITVDEAAIWKRALASDEIAALYRRGALGLELQVRVCPDGTCDGEPFVGPDGTAATAFTEADLVGPAGSQTGNLRGLGLVGPVAQYRARFSTSDPEQSPALGLVKLTATR